MDSRRLRRACGLAWAVALLSVPAASQAVTVTVGPNPLPPTVNAPWYILGANSFTVVGTAYSPDPSDYMAAPADGTVTGFRLIGVRGTGGILELKVVHPDGNGNFTGTQTSADAADINGNLNATSLPIQAGDRVGVRVFGGNSGQTSSMTSSGSNKGQSLYFSGSLGATPAAPGSNAAPTEVPQVNADVSLLGPVVDGISPTSGQQAGGETVTITGQHLAVATGVTFGGVPATTFSGNNTQLTATAPPQGAGTVDVRVTTAGGTSATSSAARYTYEGSATPPPTGGGDGGGGGSGGTTTTTTPSGGSSVELPPADITAPSLTALSLSPSAFKPATSGPDVVAAAKGTRVSYKLSEPATVTFTVEKAVPGRRKGKSCVKPTSAPTGRKCTRYAAVKGSFQHQGTTGNNRFRFTGRLGGTTLKRGNYRLGAIALDAAGNQSAVRRHPFRVIR